MTTRVSATASALVIGLITSILVTPSPEAGASPYVDYPVAVINQGDTIYNSSTGRECAVGWLNEGYAFTAGQCGTNGDYFTDGNGNILGMFTTQYDPATRRNDFGYIKLDWYVGQGRNRYDLLPADQITRKTYFFLPSASFGYTNWGFDGSTHVVTSEFLYDGAKIGLPVTNEDNRLIGVYSGSEGEWSFVTRPDQIVESGVPIDPEMMSTKRGNAQHAQVRHFDPVSGAGEKISLPGPTPVNQGMTIWNKTQSSRCTAGYVADGIVFTSGHCGKEGDEFWLADDSHVPLEVIGTFSTKYKHDESIPEEERVMLRNDAGFIKIASPWVTQGENIVSGDEMIPFADVNNGLEVCAWGMTTQEERCGKVLGTDGAEILMDSGVRGEKGDSGGPVYIKGKGGFVGLYSGNKGGYGTATRPDLQTHNVNEVGIDLWGILRALQFNIPYIQLIPVFHSYLGEMGEEIPLPSDVFNQGDVLFDYHGNPACVVGFVEENRIFVPRECFYLRTRLDREIGKRVDAAEGSWYSIASAEITGPRMSTGANRPGMDVQIPWEDTTPGDQVCARGYQTGQESCTTLLGMKGPRLVLKEPFTGEFGLPGTPLQIPGKGFAGVYAGGYGSLGVGTRIDMVADTAWGDLKLFEVEQAFDLGEPFIQKTPTYYVDAAMVRGERVEFPKRTFKVGEKLYNFGGSEAVCEITRVENNRLIVSSECPTELYTRLGEKVGDNTNVYLGTDEVATVVVTGEGMAAGDDTQDNLVPWDQLQPGDRVCAGNQCTEFAGFDGSKLILASDLNGVIPGAALSVEGKGVVGVYHRGGTGSRTDMVDDGYQASNADNIRAAFTRGEQYYAHNEAKFWNVSAGVGEAVPFPSRSLDQGTLLYDASGNPTCTVGYVDGTYLFTDADCGSGTAYSAAGEVIGEYAPAQTRGARGTVATVEVTGRRMQAGKNSTTGHAKWNEVKPGEQICGDTGCGTFFGLDGANIIHNAPAQHPGEPLKLSDGRFVGLHNSTGSDFSVGSRIDMITPTGTPLHADAVKLAGQRKAPYYQQADANFWDPQKGKRQAVPFPELTLSEGAKLHGSKGNIVCEVGRTQDNQLIVSSACGTGPFYTAGGQEIGAATNPAGKGERTSVAAVNVSSKRMNVGPSTGNTVSWTELAPGEGIWTSAGRGTFLGLDGANIIHTAPGQPGMALYTDTGFVGIYGKSGGAYNIGSRADMVTDARTASYADSVARAFERGAPYIQQADANFWSPAMGKGSPVPFATQTIDQGAALYNAEGTQTCEVGYVNGNRLLISLQCGNGPFYTAAGQQLGTADNGVLTVIAKRFNVGTNSRELVSWDELTPGETVYTAEGQGTFYGLDGARIVHDAPAPAHPGAALWTDKGFIGVHDTDEGTYRLGSRTDMVSEPGTPSFADRVIRAYDRGATYFQVAAARFRANTTPVPFPKEELNQGSLLYDASGNPSCTIGLIGQGVIFTSPGCGSQVYTKAGELIGDVVVPAADTSVRNNFAYVAPVAGPFTSGKNTVTGDGQVAWNNVRPGDQVCAFGAESKQRCGTYLGQDGSNMILSSELSGVDVDLGGPVWVPGKGFIGVFAPSYGGPNVAARVDMISPKLPSYASDVISAHRSGQPYYQQAPANFFRVNNPNGRPVPFPQRPKLNPTRPNEPEPNQPGPDQKGGAEGGSSTGGIVAAVLVPLLLLALGFLATQVIDVTQFGLSAVPKILPI